MKIYIDDDYVCHTSNDGALREIETDFFDGKSKQFIEGYRFVPSNETWTRSDGATFTGEMIAPWKNYSILSEAQFAYEEAKLETQSELDDMQNALSILGVEE